MPLEAIEFATIGAATGNEHRRLHGGGSDLFLEERWTGPAEGWGAGAEDGAQSPGCPGLPLDVEGLQCIPDDNYMAKVTSLQCYCHILVITKYPGGGFFRLATSGPIDGSHLQPLSLQLFYTS